MKCITAALCILICSNLYSQLEENWSVSAQLSTSLSYFYPIFKKTSDDKLIVVGANKVLQYDTLGSLLWTHDLDGNAINLSSVGKYNNHIALDDDDNSYVISNLVTYTNGSDTTLEAVQTVKLDPDGNAVWSTQYQYNDSYYMDLGAAITHADDAIYVTGRSIDSLNYCDLFLVKYDALDGSEIWRTTFHDEGDDCDRGDVVLVDDAGNIYVAGKSSTSQNNEYLLLKYDSSGSLLWSARHENADFIFTLLTDMVMTSEGNLVLSGYYYATVCYSPEGELLWEYTPPTNLPFNVTSDRTYDIIATENGEVILTGNHRDVGGPPNEHDILTVKLSNTGELIWENRYNTSEILQYSTGYDLFIDEEGDVYVGGKSKLEQGDDFNDNFAILKISGATGELIWDFVDYYNPDEDDVIRSLHVDPSGSVYVTGTNVISGETQFLTTKYVSVPISVFEFELFPGDFILAPNPASGGSINISSATYNGQTVAISMYDLNGRLLRQTQNYIVGRELALPQTNKGMYLIQIATSSETYNVKVLVE